MKTPTFLLFIILCLCGCIPKNNSNKLLVNTAKDSILDNTKSDSQEFDSTIFKSSAYGYSLKIPEKWVTKTKSYTTDFDLKLIDNMGGSVIIKVEKLVEETNESAFQLFNQFSDSDLEKMYSNANSISKLLKRECYTIDKNEWCFIKVESKERTSKVVLIHNFYLSCYHGMLYTITMTCFKEKDKETAEAFQKILSSFKY